MAHYSQFLYSAQQVRELDRIAIEEMGIAGFELMQRAGRTALDYLLSQWPRTRRIACLCGSGNNGGDGYVLAQLARQRGFEAIVIALSDARSETARQARELYCQHGGQVSGLDQAQLNQFDVLVDGVLGTGLERAVEGTYKSAINAINATAVPCLALDLPSGLHADTGAVLGTAVRAQATISFIGHKLGVWTGRGRAFSGRIGFSDLQVPQEMYSKVAPAARRIDPNFDNLHLTQRPRDAHKGNSGRVLVVGGDLGMPGAVALCGVSAYRAGAGLVTLATRPEHAASAISVAPELMPRGIQGGVDLGDLLPMTDVVAVGPGLGTAQWGRSLLARVLEWRGPVVLDADALNLLAQDPQKRSDWILTPHPGEAARLLNTDAHSVQENRPEAIRGLQQAYGGVVILKGSGTLIHDGETLWLCDAGNPGMASGGMGDVLTGVIAALVAQGSTLSAAARYGAWLHATAADDAVAFLGERGLTASDLWPYVRIRCNA